jgi:hypothetical protein
MIRFAIVFVSLVAALPSIAAGGGGAGGAGAQNAVNSGRSAAERQPGPLGAVNNPRPRPSEPRSAEQPTQQKSKTH